MKWTFVNQGFNGSACSCKVLHELASWKLDLQFSNVWLCKQQTSTNCLRESFCKVTWRWFLWLSKKLWWCPWNGDVMCSIIFFHSCSYLFEATMSAYCQRTSTLIWWRELTAMSTFPDHFRLPPLIWWADLIFVTDTSCLTSEVTSSVFAKRLERLQFLQAACYLVSMRKWPRNTWSGSCELYSFGTWHHDMWTAPNAATNI